MKPLNRHRAVRKIAQRARENRHVARSGAGRPAAALKRRAEPSVAFALGGLAGSNAHGAGFLQAALDTGLHPGMISCTSGQILWVYRYLLARQDLTAKDALRDELRAEISDAIPLPSRDLALAALGVWGKQGIIRLAWAEAGVDFVINSLRAMGRMALAPSEAFFTRELLHAVPARQLVMQRPDALFERIAEAFAQCDDIGIIFNSYDPMQGHEHLHLNHRARVLLQKLDDTRSKVRGERTTYESITPQAVRNGLWIYQYGFDNHHVVDGAYHRQIILDELVWANDIFVARPIKYRWQGDMPKTWPEVEDLKTEMYFDGSYRSECDKLAIVNKLIKEKALGREKQSKYHHIDIVEIELETQRSYFDYLFEDERVFTSARTRASGEFTKFLARRLPNAA